MWSEQSQQRLNELQLRDANGSLTTAERREREMLLQTLEAIEADALRPALSQLAEERQSLRQEIDHVQAQNAELEVLSGRYERLLARVRQQLDDLSDERAALRADYERVLR